MRVGSLKTGVCLASRNSGWSVIRVAQRWLRSAAQSRGVPEAVFTQTTTPSKGATSTCRSTSRHHVHILPHVREHGHVPFLSAHSLGFGGQITHVCHDMGRPPRPAPSAIRQTRNQHPSFGNVGRRCPTDQGHQEHAPFIPRNPETKRVLLVADKAFTLSALEGASAQRGSLGRIEPGAFF